MNKGLMVLGIIIVISSVYLSVYGIACVLNSRINKLLLSFGQKRKVISFRKNPIEATVNIIVFLVLGLCGLIGGMGLILVSLSIIK